MNKSESKYFHTAVRFDKALLSLLEKKPLEYITIREICETAGVNRSTFYLHYENISDLLKETTAYVLEDFTSYFPVDPGAITEKFADCDPYLTFVKENQRVFSTVLSQQTAFESKAIFQRLFDNIFKPILDRFHYPEDEQNYVMMFYLNGITAIITEWLRDGCTKSVEQIAAIIRDCVYGKEL